MRQLLLVAAALQGGATSAPAPVPADPTTPTSAASALPAEIVPRAWLTLPALDATGRRAFNANAVFAKHLLDPNAEPPQVDGALRGDLANERKWQAAEPDAEGRVGVG